MSEVKRGRASDEVKLRRAGSGDAAAVGACVRHAYARYEGRLPRPPKPVLADYAEVVERTSTFLLESPAGGCVGVLVLITQSDHLLLDNVAVEPGWQGRGLGRRLLQLAESEALRLGFSEVRLYTNALMLENRELYARVGYREYERREVEGRDTIFMRKHLPPRPA